MRRGVVLVAVASLAAAGVAALVRPWEVPERAEPAPEAASDAPGAKPPEPLLAGTRGSPKARGAAEGEALAVPAARPEGERRRIEGVVLDAERRPIAGARVRAVGASEPAPEATADADGRFVPDLASAAAFALTVTAPGLVEARVPAEAVMSGMRVALSAGWTISGAVEDAETGEAVDGLAVSVSPAASPDSPLPSSESTRWDGTFVLSLPADGEYVLHVGAAWAAPRLGADYVPTEVVGVPAGTACLRIRVVRGLAIEGRVLDDRGDPVTFRVSVDAIGRTPAGDPDYTRRRHVRLEDGNLRVSGLAAGRYDLWFWFRPDARPLGAGRLPASATVVRDVAAGTSGLVVRLRAGLALTGRVVDDAGDPVLGVGNLLAYRAGETGRGSPVFGEVPGDGTFSFPALEEGQNYDLRAYGFRSRGAGTALRVRPGDVGISIVLRRAGRITGRIVAEDG